MNKFAAAGAAALLVATMIVPRTTEAQYSFLTALDSVQMASGGDGTGLCVREVDDGYLVLCQQYTEDSLSTPREHLFVRKLDLQGELVWTKELVSGAQLDHVVSQWGTAPVDRYHPSEIVTTVREWDSQANPPWDHVLYWLDEQGDTTRTTKFIEGDTLIDEGWMFQQTAVLPDKRVAIAGSHYANGIAEGGLVLTDDTGAVLWSRAYPSTEMINSVAPNFDGGFYIAGQRPGNQFIGHFLIRTDSLGDVVWWTNVPGYSNGRIQVRLLSDSAVATWHTYTTTLGLPDTMDFRFSKYAPNGSLILFRDVPTIGKSSSSDMEQMPDGSFICSSNWGNTYRFSKISALGDSLWDRYYFFYTLGTHHLVDVEPTSDGGVIATGMAKQRAGDPFPGLYTIMVLKLDSMGCLQPGCHTLGVSDMVLDLGTRLLLHPNPADQWVHLELELPPGLEVRGIIMATMLDAMGRVVGRWPVTRNGNRLERTIPCPDTRGMYSIHVTDEQRWLAGNPLIVQ